MNKSQRRRGRRFALVIATVAMLGTLFPNTALAADGFELTIPITSIVRGGEGDAILQAQESVPADSQGQTCAVRAEAYNQDSVHPNSDLLVRSGDTEVVIPDVERDPDGIIQGQGTLVLGSEIAVYVRLGADEVFSGGFDVIIDCTPPTGGWVCDDGVVEFLDDTSGYDGTVYETEEEAANDPACSEVSAATTFTISGSCLVSDGVPSFTISGNLGEGLTLDVAGETIASVGAYALELDAPGAYPYVVTVADGFELADGSPPADGVVDVIDCGSVPPSGWACVDGQPTFIEDATNFDGTLYATQQEAADDPDCVEVEASIVVTLGIACASNNDGLATISVDTSIAGGADVVVRDSNGSVIGEFDDDGTLSVADDSTYTWNATPNEGFEFPAGAASSGTLSVGVCAKVLPFTGIDTTVLALLASCLIAGGAFILRPSWKKEAG